MLAIAASLKKTPKRHKRALLKKTNNILNLNHQTSWLLGTTGHPLVAGDEIVRQSQEATRPRRESDRQEGLLCLALVECRTTFGKRWRFFLCLQHGKRSQVS